MLENCNQVKVSLQTKKLVEVKYKQSIDQKKYLSKIKKTVVLKVLK